MQKIYEKEVPEFLKNKRQMPYRANMTRVGADVLIKKFMDSLLFYFENPTMVNEELLTLKFKEIVLLLLNTKDAPVIKEIMYNFFFAKIFLVQACGRVTHFFTTFCSGHCSTNPSQPGII